MSTQFALFDTAIGACGIAWNEAGVVALQLPEADRERTRTRLVRRWPDACETAPPPAPWPTAIEDRRHARVRHGPRSHRGRSRGRLRSILRTSPAFDRKVYAVARTIAPGKTLTYGEVAARIDEPGAAREVGQALGRNRIPIIVPCHRVVAAGGATADFPRAAASTPSCACSKSSVRRSPTDRHLFDDDAAFARLQRRKA